eukprot:8178575-Lingulodinium_polyedra.AAC.1
MFRDDGPVLPRGGDHGVAPAVVPEARPLLEPPSLEQRIRKPAATGRVARNHRNGRLTPP